MEGTCTGEHGIGQAKMKYMSAEFNAATLDFMARIKRALDPKNIMNPGKIVAV
jgi:D-lactate dehydrogenase (cytochrome)